MKTEILHHYTQRHGLSLRQRAIAWLPRYAPRVARLAGMVNFLSALSITPLVLEKLLGFSRYRRMPRWSTRSLVRPASTQGGAGREATDEEIQCGFMHAQSVGG